MTNQNDAINNYTSTGVKFWKHHYQMINYKNGNPSTVISCHVSPTSRCNLGCSYCSVKRRNENEIELDVIKDFIEKLITRGLHAVIISGGGEPCLYPKINELLKWLKYDKELNIGMITNGTNSDLIEDWSVFSWVRVSINLFKNWKQKISLPLDKISKETTIGLSFIDGGKCLDKIVDDLKFMIDKLGASYLRVLPNCLLASGELEEEHKRLDEIFEKHSLSQFKFFHQYKTHEENNFDVCHQGFFRPYLSEVGGGSIFSCDSVVLNDGNRCFDKKYLICKAEDVLEFLDGKIKPKFSPKKDCDGCVFLNNLALLDDWKNGKIDLFDEYKDKHFEHEDFV
jgi:organic radical activating enzyme